MKRQEAITRDVILRLVANFPGFVTDEEVNGADLVDWLSNEILYLSQDPELDQEMRNRALTGTPDDDES